MLHVGLDSAKRRRLRAALPSAAWRFLAIGCSANTYHDPTYDAEPQTLRTAPGGILCRTDRRRRPASLLHHGPEHDRPVHGAAWSSRSSAAAAWCSSRSRCPTPRTRSGPRARSSTIASTRCSTARPCASPAWRGSPAHAARVAAGDLTASRFIGVNPFRPQVRVHRPRRRSPDPYARALPMHLVILILAIAYVEIVHRGPAR